MKFILILNLLLRIKQIGNWLLTCEILTIFEIFIANRFFVCLQNC